MEYNKLPKFYDFDLDVSPPGYSHIYPAKENNSIPGINCDVCGSTWGTSRIGPHDVPKQALEILKILGSPWPIDRIEHEKLMKEIKKILNNEEQSKVLEPGMRLGPYLIELTGYKIPSFMGIVAEIVVPESVLDILVKEGITGFKAYPVKVMKIPKPKKPGDVLPKLYELQIVGHSDLKMKESGVKIKEKCDACGRVAYTVYKKIVHDVEKWDGSDMFRFDYYLITFATEKFKKVCEKYKFTNCKFKPMEEMSHE